MRSASDALQARPRGGLALTRMLIASTEDTFILLDALEADADDLASRQPLICLEIG